MVDKLAIKSDQLGEAISRNFITIESDEWNQPHNWSPFVMDGIGLLK